MCARFSLHRFEFINFGVTFRDIGLTESSQDTDRLKARIILLISI